MDPNSHLATFHRLAAVLDNHDAFLHAVSELNETQLGNVLEYLVRLRVARDKAVRKCQDKFKEQSGVSAPWHYTKSNAEAYQRKLEKNKQYMRTKRAAQASA